MTRPRINPAVRFRAAASFLDTCLENNGGRIWCDSEAHATTTLHLLNRYRKACREIDPDGVTMLDHYVFRKNGMAVEVIWRNEMDLRRVETLNGEPLAVNERDLSGAKPDNVKIDMDLVRALQSQHGIKDDDDNEPTNKIASEIRERDIEAARKPLKLDE